MATINGTQNSETLNGTTGDDTITGNGGNDILIDDRGNDWLRGGAGNDTMTGGAGINDYWGGAGNDTVQVIARAAASDDLVHDLVQGSDKIDVSAWGVSDFNQLSDLLFTDSHNDAAFNAFYNDSDHVMRIAGVDVSQLSAADFVFATTGPANQTGTSNDDVLFGSAAANILNGGGGDDILLGGAGDDTLIGGPGLDLYDGGSGFDRVSYTYSTDEGVRVNLATGTVTFGDGATEDLRSIEGVAGSQVADTLTGDSGKNVLYGYGGNDVISGGAGRDSISGGLGADHLSGQVGNDIFVYGAANESTTSSRDTIEDFSTGDHISFVGLEASSGQNLHFIGGAAFSHTAGELQVVAEGSNTAVNVDINGDGVADTSILLTGAHAMTGADFLL